MPPGCREGLNYHSGQLGMLLAAQEMLEEKLV